MGRLLVVVGAVGLLAGCHSALSSFTAAPSTLEGRIGTHSPDLPVRGAVVYLEPNESDQRPLSETVASARLRAGTFLAEAQVIPAGRPVEFAVEGDILHRIFSSDKDNAFEIATSGDARTVTLEHPGVVPFYCSLHPNEGGILYVVPSRWFALAGESGTWRIPDVPAGRYHLTAFGAGGSADRRSITLPLAAPEDLDLTLVADEVYAQ